MEFNNLNTKVQNIGKTLRDGLISLLIVIFISILWGILFGYEKIGNLTILLILAGPIIIFYEHSIINLNSGCEFHIKGEYDAALKFYNKALKLNPFLAAAYSNRGFIYTEKNEYELAKSNFNRAIKLKATPNAYFELLPVK